MLTWHNTSQANELLKEKLWIITSFFYFKFAHDSCLGMYPECCDIVVDYHEIHEQRDGW